MKMNIKLLHLILKKVNFNVVVIQNNFLIIKIRIYNSSNMMK